MPEYEEQCCHWITVNCTHARTHLKGHVIYCYILLKVSITTPETILTPLILIRALLTLQLVYIIKVMDNGQVSIIVDPTNLTNTNLND